MRRMGMLVTMVLGFCVGRGYGDTVRLGPDPLTWTGEADVESGGDLWEYWSYGDFDGEIRGILKEDERTGEVQVEMDSGAVDVGVMVEMEDEREGDFEAAAARRGEEGERVGVGEGGGMWTVGIGMMGLWWRRRRR